MELSVSHQAFVFTAMFFCGFPAGMIFDIFRGIRKSVKCSPGVVAAQDIVLWFSELIVVYLVLFKVNNASVRLYEIIGLVLGIVSYFMTFSQYVVKSVFTALEFFKKAAMPFVNIAKKIALSAKNAAKIIDKNAKNGAKFLINAAKKNFSAAKNTFLRKKA